ncbi:hypothetical protein DFQ28_004662 [Apophysomyces sp. BC1034]|nr:hypothetical protein DFQ30_005640 [Apophysomyces sp. BC1015]KAG0183079.1 hypothetical protein DFQ29_000082 [Apophysomyces sp. BC1021]KAG0193542.1 hypothetical protein DFQ28_004662 [Apophysomyces sp. BC1034]
MTSDSTQLADKTHVEALSTELSFTSLSSPPKGQSPSIKSHASSSHVQKPDDASDSPRSSYSGVNGPPAAHIASNPSTPTMPHHPTTPTDPRGPIYSPSASPAMSHMQPRHQGPGAEMHRPSYYQQNGSVGPSIYPAEPLMHGQQGVVMPSQQPSPTMQQQQPYYPADNGHPPENGVQHFPPRGPADGYNRPPPPPPSSNYRPAQPFYSHQGSSVPSNVGQSQFAEQVMYGRPESMYSMTGSVYNRPPGSNQPRPYPPVVAADNAYMPDSSLLAASYAGRKRKDSKFPPATFENLSKFRNEAKTSGDPRLLLDLAKYLLEAVPQVCINEPDPKRANKVREAMTMEAQKIVKKLATHSGIGKTGYAEAQFFLGNCYSSGLMGLQTDPEKAFGLYVQGSKQSHPGCTYRAAVCYDVGAGTKRDKGHAIQFYRKAANLGDLNAMYKLGVILLKGGLGQPKNPREGISWLKRAASQADEDHPYSLHELGLAYETEGIPSVIPDVNYARDLFTQAAQYGYAPSQVKLGIAYENGLLNCPVDPRRSIAWYSKAAEQGHLEAELSLSGWYLTGTEGILRQNDAEAYLWARKAADRGYAKAEYAVGYYTETGIGIRQNLDEAKKWYMRAAAQNNQRAMQRLTELKKYGNARPQHRKKHTRTADSNSASKDSDCTIM